MVRATRRTRAAEDEAKKDENVLEFLSKIANALERRGLKDWKVRYCDTGACHATLEPSLLVGYRWNEMQFKSIVCDHITN
jgi:hypothetical protein